MEVFDYLDYRAFLRDWFNAKKIENPKFSYRVLAKKVGFQSAGFFTQILQGKTNISHNVMEGFCDCIRFQKKEKEYFQALVLFNQTDDPKRKSIQKAKLDGLRAIEVKTLAPETFRLMEKWHHSAIRELLCIAPFRGDYQALAKMLRPQISADDAEGSIKLLLELGLIRKNAQGVFEKVDDVISTGYAAAGPVLEQHFLSMSRLGESAMRRFARQDRNLSWVTVAVSKDKYSEIVDEVRHFRRRILQMAQAESQPDLVCHLSLALFPLAGRDLAESA